MKEDINIQSMAQSNKKILIVDDDERNIFALSAVLKARSFECITATSGIEALTILKNEENIAAALIDMMMPDMDGYELINIMQSDDAFTSIPLVAITAQAMPGDREKCLKAGADAYVSKPVDVDVLMNVLHDLFINKAISA